MYEVRSLGELRLELFTQMKSQIAFSDFCMPAGTIDFSANDGFLMNSLCLFKLSFPNYELEANVSDGMVFIRRNGFYQHSERYTGKDRCHVAIQWDVDSIACGILPSAKASDSMNQHMRAVHTPVTIPPSELIYLLRTENLSVNSAFRTPDELFTTVLDCLHLCEADIRRHGGEQFIWGKGGDANKPLNEPEISKYVAAFFSSHGAARNFDVTCESIAGSGNLDFYVIAPIQRQGLAKIAIEAKKADNARVEHGLSTQLHEYMARIGTNYGIFLIYWLRSTNYPYPTAQESYSQFEIEVLHPILRLPTVRSVGLNLSHGATPSKK